MTTRVEKYSRFDAADYLDGTDAAAYLHIALDGSEDDPTAVPRALGIIARSQDMNGLARRVGMRGAVEVIAEETSHLFTATD
jgi:DNA-binding phage protein